jgi:hypothetical protein
VKEEADTPPPSRVQVKEEEEEEEEEDTPLPSLPLKKRQGREWQPPQEYATRRL